MVTKNNFFFLQDKTRIIYYSFYFYFYSLSFCCKEKVSISYFMRKKKKGDDDSFIPMYYSAYIQVNRSGGPGVLLVLLFSHSYTEPFFFFSIIKIILVINLLFLG